MTMPAAVLTNETIVQFSNGDTEAFNVLYSQLWWLAFSHAKKYLPEQEAEEVTGDVFVIIWNRRQEFTTLPALRKFLLVCVRNASLNIIRKNKLSRTVSVEEVNELFSEEDKSTLIRFDVMNAVEDAINTLPPQQREVILLAYKFGYKPDVIAQKMGLSPQTVKNHKRLALEKLRNKLSLVDFLCLVAIIERHFS